MIQNILQTEQPYEKCLHKGVSALSDTELLAVLLRTGTKGTSVMELAMHILGPQCGEDGILNLHRLTLDKLMEIKGIGEVKGIQLICLSELAKRMAKASAKEGLLLNHPSTIADYYMEDMRHLEQEELKLLMLNTKSRLLGEADVFKGTVNASLISPRELFITALEKHAVGIILLHNHPSGDPTPSTSDILLTKRIKEAGSLLGIELLDHIIIGNNCYMSFVEQKLI